MTHYSEANPMMGTVANEVEGAGGGKTYPGAALPFGMIQLSPDTITGGDNGAGYSYGHPTIEGFSWVHLSGIGWYGEFGNLQTMPISGSRRYYSKTNEYVRKPIGDAGWESRFDHETEIAQPGYYAVELTDCRVPVRCALPSTMAAKTTWPWISTGASAVIPTRRASASWTRRRWRAACCAHPPAAAGDTAPATRAMKFTL